MTRRRTTLVLGLVVALLAPCWLFAQPTPAVPRVGVVYLGWPDTTDKPMRDAFANGLRAHGYVVGKNILLDERFSEGRVDLLPEIIRDLIGRKPQAIVVPGSQAVHAAKAATSTIPIVMGSVADPVGQGLVASLARPGGNITGIAILSEVLIAKRLELLLEILPKAKRVGYLANPSNPVSAALLNHLRAAAGKRSVAVVPFNASNVGELDEALTKIASQRVDALMLSQDVLVFTFNKRIAEFLSRNRVPAIHGFSEAVPDGGLISYAASSQELWRNAANFVARILKGAKPGDLPIEQPTRMEMFVNLKAARALGISIPQSVLLRADRVIE